MNFTNEEIGVMIKAAKHAIRTGDFEQVSIRLQDIGSLSTSSVSLESDQFEDGYIYIITSICAYEIGTGTPLVYVGMVDGSTDFWYKIVQVTTANESVEYVGQLILKPTDKIKVTFTTAVAADSIYANANGYRIKAKI